MVRIDRDSDGQTTILTLTGRVQSEHLDELRAQIESNGPRVILNLEAVTLADMDVVQFLSKCEQAGMTLFHCPLFLREWILRERDAQQ